VLGAEVEHLLVSARPPVEDPAKERRPPKRENTAIGRGSDGAPTLPIVPFLRSNCR
jgi:hypothetical protein